MLESTGTIDDKNLVSTSTTDEDGIFKFTVSNPGQYTIVYMKKGYHRGIISKL